MPWVGDTFTLVHDFVADRDAGRPDSLISPEKVMEMFQDLADAMPNFMNIDGTALPIAPINMNDQRLTNLAEGTQDTDAVTVAQAASGLDWVGTFGGTSARITVTHSPAPDTIPTGFRFSGVVAHTNVRAPVLSINGGADLVIKTRYGAELQAGDLYAGAMATLRKLPDHWRVESIVPTDFVSGGASPDFSDNPNKLLKTTAVGAFEAFVPGAAGIVALDEDGTVNFIETLTGTADGTTIKMSIIDGDDGPSIGTVQELAVDIADFTTFTRKGII